MDRISIDSFLNLEGSIPILDVRSPSEFQAGHIPGAISFPLFTDEERAIVGTAYKQESKEIAVKKGLEIVGPKMVEFIESAERLGSPAFRVYCWRGGMRSESLSWLLEKYGFQTMVLEGGYKSYRGRIQEFFQQELSLKIITGYTGSGKTILLQEMAKEGLQVVDLEGLANHQGSTFGYQKSDGQPTTEHFQNLLLYHFLSLDLSKDIWLEDESMRIGDVNLNEQLFDQMSKSPHVFIEVSDEDRITHLVGDYEMLSKAQLSKATNTISKRLGKQRTQLALAFIEAGELALATEQILPYYDKYYKKSMDKKKQLITTSYKLENRDYAALAQKIKQDYDS